MRIAIVAAAVFLLGIGPGVIHAGAPIEGSQRSHRTALAAEEAPSHHPVLTRVAGLLKIRL